MDTKQNYDPGAGQPTPVESTDNQLGQTAQNTPLTAPLAYGTWPVHPTLHRPTFIRPDATASTLATHSAMHIKHLGVRYADICNHLAADETGPINVVEPLSMSLMMAADFREGRNTPSTALIAWLSAVHRRVNVNYLFRGEGEPLLPAAPALNSTDRLTGDALEAALTSLTDRLHAQVYPLLTDPAHTIYEPGEEGEENEVVTLSEQALAINLHREFVEALGPHQADWFVAYWQELGWLFERLFGYGEQRVHLLHDRVFIELIQSFAA